MTRADAQFMEDVVLRGQTVDILGPEFDQLGDRYSGKVRENFQRDGIRTIVVTDRVSAFDVVLGTIPLKGQVLNRLAGWWFERTADVWPNHIIAQPDAQASKTLQCKPLPLEIVVRSYLTGVTSTSIWSAYSSGRRRFCGHTLAEGMRKHQRLARPIVTPSTKAEKGGHDESVSAVELIGRGLVTGEDYEVLEARSLELFARGQEIAASRGLILVDTKYEVGQHDEHGLVLIDEIHTPDSSRYWWADSYEQAMRDGTDPRSLDKEFLRRWLAGEGYLGDGPIPEIPMDVRVEAGLRYVELFELLTGSVFVPDERDPIPRLRAHLLGDTGA